MENFEIKEPDMLILINDSKERAKVEKNLSDFLKEKLSKKDFKKEINKIRKEQNENIITDKKILSTLYCHYLIKLHEKYPVHFSYWEGEPGEVAYNYILKANAFIKGLIKNGYEELRNETDINKIKILFEHDKNLVKQNENIYPILFNYENYIKSEILKANFHKPTIINVFKYISDTTNKRIKETAIKKYYYSTFLDLLKGFKINEIENSNL